MKSEGNRKITRAEREANLLHWNQMLATFASAGAAAIFAAGGCAYAGLSSQSQLFGRTIVAGRNPREIALTYDDGPNDPWTSHLLDLLALHDLHATFFLIGRFVRQRPELVREIRDAGHLIGNHTMTHPWLTAQSLRRVREELAGCNAALEDVLGERVRFFRPPHGARRPDVLLAARELGLNPVMWNAIGYDWRANISAAAIASHVERDFARNRRRRRGSNLVLHDGSHTALGADRSQTVEATRQILDRHPPASTQYRTVDAWT